MKAHRILRPRRFLHWLSIFVLSAGTGCQTGPDWSLTHRLWENESFRRLNEPAADPHVELFADEQHSEVLVAYDEVRNNGRIHRRAFFVNRNLNRLRAGKKPRFVSPKTAALLKPLPIVRVDSGEQIPARGPSVVLSGKTGEASLYRDGELSAKVELPVYGATGTWQKTLLTPLAVTGDTLIVATVVGLFVAYAWAWGGAPLPDCR